MLEDLKKKLFGSNAEEQASSVDSDVVMYTTRFCPYCLQAKALLTSKGISFHDIAVDGNSELRAEMTKKANSHTVPQIWIGDVHVGGCQELFELERNGQLDALIEES